MVILFTFGTVIRYHALLILGSMPNLSNYGHFLYILSICDNSEKNGLISIMLSIQVSCVADACKI